MVWSGTRGTNARDSNTLCVSCEARTEPAQKMRENVER